jgi:hypothetical protein
MVCGGFTRTAARTSSAAFSDHSTTCFHFTNSGHVPRHSFELTC